VLVEDQLTSTRPSISTSISENFNHSQQQTMKYKMALVIIGYVFVAC
jgi:hypothetical protein